MQHAGDRAFGSGTDIGRGAGDGAGDGNAAKQGRADIGRALRHELGIGAVPPAGHAIGDHRRKQQLDGAEKRDGGGIGQHGLQLRKTEGRKLRLRQMLRQAAEARRPSQRRGRGRR